GAGKCAKLHVGHREAEHVVTEKFQPLVGAGTVARAGQGGNMRERLLEQRRILEMVPDALFEGVGGRASALAALCRGFARAIRRHRPPCSAAVWAPTLLSPACGGHNGGRGRRFGSSPAPHLTIVNKRLQRTDKGQRQIIQACSPSAIEKKMIWARPTIFSNW